MRTHIAQVKALLRGEVADINGGLAQILASDGWLPDRPINVPVYMAGQGPKARARQRDYRRPDFPRRPGRRVRDLPRRRPTARSIDDGEDVTSPRASTAVKP